MSQYKKYLLQKSLISEDKIVITGREVTISQASFIKADARAARTILENLRSNSYCMAQIIKVVES
jgi:hypothetical protein